MSEYPSFDQPTSGSIRFNTDSSKLEIYNGEAWFEIDATSPELQTGGSRGLMGGGNTPAVTNAIDFINIDTTGESSDFGDLSYARRGVAALASRTRGVFAGGRTSEDNNGIDFVTIASTGNAADFGDLTITSHHGCGISDGTRGIITAIENSSWTNNNSNRIDFITIASTGNANDFGDLYTGTRETGGCESKTRGIVFGGTPSRLNIIQYFTISTQGDSADFGDVSAVCSRGSAADGNSVRGLLPLGGTPSLFDTVEFITIATLGNATDFGDLTEARGGAAGCSSPTRHTVAGGFAPGLVDTIDYTQIMTKGDYKAFGELSGADRQQFQGCSNGHGGLG